MRQRRHQRKHDRSGHGSRGAHETERAAPSGNRESRARRQREPRRREKEKIGADGRRRGYFAGRFEQ